MAVGRFISASRFEFKHFQSGHGFRQPGGSSLKASALILKPLIENMLPVWFIL
jgi:hypothetical protein